MAQTSILPKIKIFGTPKDSNYIPLEHNVYATQRVGKITPYMCRWADAGNTNKINLETLNYMAPMVSPTVGDIRLKHWLYFIGIDKLIPNLAAMFAREKAIDGTGHEYEVTEVPHMTLQYMTALCLIGSFCTVYVKDHYKGVGLKPQYMDGKTYLFPSNYSNGGDTFLDSMNDIWSAKTGYNFIDSSTPPAFSLNSVFTTYNSLYTGGMSTKCLNAKWLFVNNPVENIHSEMDVLIPIANPEYDSLIDWRDSNGKPMYTSDHLDKTHGIDCTPVSLDNPDYCVTRSFTLLDDSNVQHDVSFTFAFRFSDFGAALRDIIIASGYQLDLSSTKPYSILPLFANFLAYYYAQPLVKYKQWQNTAAYKLLRVVDTNSITSMNFNEMMEYVYGTPSYRRSLFAEFINDLAFMWAIEPQDFVSMHTREPITSPLVFNSLDSFVNGVASGVSSGNNNQVPIDQQSDSRTEPAAVSANNLPYIDNINHDVTTASLLKRITQRACVNSVIGRPIRKLLEVSGFGNWLDTESPQLVDYGELRLNLKPVVSTSDTSNSDGRGADLGQLGGRGYGHANHKSKTYKNRQPGYFVLLTSVYVNSGYCQAIDANNACVDVDDFYRRDFDAQGFEIDEKNLVHGSLTWVEEGDANKLNESFGYAPRSSKFKVISNKLLGDFTNGERFDTYAPYHLEKLLPIGQRSINTKYDVEIIQGYHFRQIEMGSRFAPADTPIAGNIWRYLGRFPWLGQYDRIFKLYDYDVRKIQGVFGLESNNFFETVSKIFSYFIRSPENYVFLNTIHYDSWQNKKPISESFGTLSDVFEGKANDSSVKA